MAIEAHCFLCCPKSALQCLCQTAHIRGAHERFERGLRFREKRKPRLLFCRHKNSARQGTYAEHGIGFLRHSFAQPCKLPIVKRSEEAQRDGRGRHCAPLGINRFAVEKKLCRLRIFLTPLRRGPKHIEECFVRSLAVEDRTHSRASFVLRQKLMAHHTTVQFFLGAHETAGKLEPIVAMQIVSEAVSFLQESVLLCFYPRNSATGSQLAE